MKVTLPLWIGNIKGQHFSTSVEITGDLGTVLFDGVVVADSQSTAQAIQQTRAQQYYDSLLHPSAGPVAEMQDADLAPVNFEQVVARLVKTEQRLSIAENGLRILAKGINDELPGGHVLQLAAAAVLASLGEPASPKFNYALHSEVRPKD